VVRRLLAAGANPTAPSQDRWTPLHYALLAHNDRIPNPERIDILRLLIARKADVNAPAGAWKVTPLHLAIARGTPAMVQVLLEAGADRGARDTDGQIPLDAAKQRQDAEILKLLQEPAAHP
jgi:ankyrin repeat protein